MTKDKQKAIVISEKQINDWEKHRDEIAAQIRRLDVELDVVVRKLEAVRVFDEQSARLFGEHPFQIINTPAAVEAVLRIGGHIKPKQIRERLKSNGYPMKRLGKNGVYLYAVLKRLYESGRIEKEGELYHISKEERND